MIESFQVGVLAALLEKKSKMLNLAKGFDKIKLISTLKSLSQKNRRVLSTQIASSNLFNDYYAKTRNRFLNSIGDVKSLKHFHLAQIDAKKNPLLSLLALAAKTKTQTAYFLLKKHKDFRKIKLRGFFENFLSVNRFKAKRCFYSLLQNNSAGTLYKTVFKIKASLLTRLVHANKAKVAAVLSQMSLANLNQKLNISNMKKRKVKAELNSIPKIDLDALNSKHLNEMKTSREEYLRSMFVRRLVSAQKFRVKLAFRNLMIPPFSEQGASPESIKKWVFKNIALNYKTKTLDSFQVLRYPTISRHEKQKSSQALNDILVENKTKLLQTSFNSILKKSDMFKNRHNPFFNSLAVYSNNNLKLGFFAIIAGNIDSAKRLSAIRSVSNLLNSKQTTFDSDFKRPCFVKLGSLLDPETSSGKKFNRQNYKFDILMEKRIKLERDNHPLILRKVNILVENQQLSKKVNKCTIQNSIYHENIKNLNESTRSLGLKKEIEIKELLCRKNLGFSFENELRKLLGDVFGESKKHKPENNSLSHVNDNLDTSNNKLGKIDQSISKNVELEESNYPINQDTGKIKAYADISNEMQKSNTTFKLNSSEKILNDMESRKILKRLKELNFENFSEKDIQIVDQTINKLCSSRNTLQELLEKIVADLNDFMALASIEEKKITGIQNRLSTSKQSFVKNEMTLIDMQDRKGMLQLEKSTLSKMNETLRHESDLAQKAINELKNATSLDASKTADLDRFKMEFFQKLEVIQKNSKQILLLDHDLVELSRNIANFIEKNSELKTNNMNLGEQEETFKRQKKDSYTRTIEMREEIQGILKHINWNSTLIERLEMKKRNVMSDSVLSQMSFEVENYVRFKDYYLKLDELAIHKAKIIVAKNELKREQKVVLDQIEGISFSIEKENELGLRTTESSTKINDLNQKWQKCTQENDVLNLKIGKLENEKNDILQQIKVEKSKIIETVSEYDEFDRRTADTGSANDTKLDLFGKNTMFITTRMNFDPLEQIESSPLRENLLNASKSNLNDENFKTILLSKLNQDIKDKMNINDDNLVVNQPFEDLLGILIRKKNDFLHNQQLSFFNFLKKEEIDNRIKANSCWILEFKERIAKNEGLIKLYRKNIRENNNKVGQTDLSIRLRKGRKLNAQKNEISLPTETTATQTDVANTYYNMQIISDQKDSITIKQRGFKLEELNFLDASIRPKVRSLTIQNLDPIVIKKVFSMKMNKNLLEFDHNDIFDSKNQKLIDDGGLELDLNGSNLRDSLILEEYFPIDISSKKQVKKINVRRISSQQISSLNVHSYQKLHDTVRVDVQIPSIEKPPKKENEISCFKAIIDNKDNFVHAKLRATEDLCRVIPKAIKNYANLSFYHLKLITSSTKLKDLMRALGQFRLNRVGNGYDKVKTQLGNQFASSLFETLQGLVLKRERTAFAKMKAIFELKRRTRNVILTKWMARGDNTMKKQLRLTLQYWKHIKNDNLWNVNILKTMVIKSPLIPQIALWRLMLFKKRDYTCPPKTVKGLLTLMSTVDTRQLNKGWKALLAHKPIGNDFHADMVEQRKNTDPGLLKSELISIKDNQRNDVAANSQRLYSVFSYFGILNKQAKMKFFYKFLKQVKEETPRSQMIRHEPKDPTVETEANPEINAVRFLLDQQIKCKSEINEKDNLISELKDELNEKNENLVFMKYYLLNYSLMRLERINKRIFNNNLEQARIILMKSLVEK